MGSRKKKSRPPETGGPPPEPPAGAVDPGDTDEIGELEDFAQPPEEVAVPLPVPPAASAGDPPDDGGEPVRLAIPQKADALKVRVIGGGGSSSHRQRRGAEKGVEFGFRIDSARPPLVRDPGPGFADSTSRDSDGDGGGDEVVHRLEADRDGDAGAESLLPVAKAPLAAPQEHFVHPSGKPKKPLTMRQWTLWMAAACPVMVVLIVVLTQLRKKPEGSDRFEPPPLRAESIPLDQSPEARFIRNVGTLNLEAGQLLDKFAAARTAEEALPYIREPERVRPALLRGWKAWPVPVVQRGKIPESLVSQDEGRTALVMTGSRGDFTPFRTYFVMDGGHLKLDWEASNAASDIEIADLPAQISTAPLTVRAYLRRDSYFGAAFPEKQYECFQLLDQGHSASIWAYAPTGSPAAARILEFLNDKSFVMEGTKEVSVTVRLQKTPGAQAKQFLILEVMNRGWVSL